MFEFGTANIPDEGMIAIICQYMGWDLATYYAQPDWFVDAIMVMRNEQERAKRSKK